MQVFTVTQVAQYLKESLEQDPVLYDMWISGEISNLRTAPSGHSYFTLKDSQSQLRSVMFKGGRGSELLAEGSLVTAHGRISFYEARGDLQVVADLVMPEGAGPLFLEMERLKMRLEEEGLFETSRKRSLPPFPTVVGLVTSPTGAVLHDIRNIISRRYPLVEVLLAPTQVQGADAVSGIVSALKSLNEDGHSDLIIVARGGGSLEELWAFNEEAVARAIYSSRIPVVSAVGHERDYTIADLVADVRAPTPSAAAELAVPDGRALIRDVQDYSEGIFRAMSQMLSIRRQEVGSMAQQLRGRAPDIVAMRLRVDDLSVAASKALSGRLALVRERISGLHKGLGALNPEAILHRGYAIVQKKRNGEVVYRKQQVATGDALDVTVSDGSIPATVGASSRKERRRKPLVRAGAPLL